MLHRCAVSVISVVAILAGAGVCAADFPERPIRVVVPYPPGGVVDPVARLLAGPLGKALNGQTLYTENRPGAAGAIGAAAVMRSQPDGYTLLFHSSTLTTTSTLTDQNARFDVKQGLTPVSMVAASPFLIVVNPDVPVHSIQELIAYAKANPGTLNYGSSGVGSSNHLAAELFKRQAGVDIVHVPFQGGGPVLTALLAGQVQVGFDTINGAGQLVQNGKLRALAVTGTTRSRTLPDVPTVAESGVPGYDVNFWLGYFAPAGTPAAVIDKLDAAVKKVTSLPEVQSRFFDIGLEQSTLTPGQFAELFRNEVDKWTQVSRTLGHME